MVKKILIIFSFMLCLIVSCSSDPSLSKNYVSYTLDRDSIPKLALRHKHCKIIYDSEGCDLKELFSQSECVYVIHYPHEVDSISIPRGCEIHFKGGSLNGRIRFNDTYLSGLVNIRNSEISGSISNNTFEAGWICNGDGVHDDAKNVNQALGVCNNIHFQKGSYLMSSFHEPFEQLEKSLHEAVKAHIGVYKSGVSLVGDDGASFLVKDKSCLITIYSLPNRINKSIKNIIINNIDFRVENDGIDFSEFSHTIKIIGVIGLRIKHCNFFDFWGDAICLSHYGDDENTGERTRNSNITITHNYIEGHSHNNRNAISIINGYKVLIDHNTIEEVSKKNMPGAIDIEPNNSAYTINKITISNNIITSSKGSGAAICVVALTKNTPTYNITIKNNIISNSTVGIAFCIQSQNNSSNFKIIGNIVEYDTPPYSFIGDGTSKNWFFKDNMFRRPTRAKIGGNIKVSNLRVE